MVGRRMGTRQCAPVNSVKGVAVLRKNYHKTIWDMISSHKTHLMFRISNFSDCLRLFVFWQTTVWSKCLEFPLFSTVSQADKSSGETVVWSKCLSSPVSSAGLISRSGVTDQFRHFLSWNPRHRELRTDRSLTR